MSADGDSSNVIPIRRKTPGEPISHEQAADLRELFGAALRGTNKVRWAADVYEHMKRNPSERTPPDLASWPTPPSVAGNGNPAIIESARKSDLKSTVTLRLRGSMRAESILREAGDERAKHLQTYHREHWRIALVSDDYSVRETQIADALALRYGR